MHHLLMALGLVLGSPWAAAGSAPAIALDWPTLQAPAEGPSNPVDAFTTLPDAQIDALRWVVRGRRAGSTAGHGADAARQHGEAAEAALRAQGVDVDGLLTTREHLMAQRRSVDEAGVPALDGTRVRLAGQLLAAHREDGGVTAYVLVPSTSACSHQPPPPANQAVHLRPAQADAAALLAGPVWVSGVLRIQPLSVMVFKVDGVQALRTTYKLDDAEITPARTEGAVPTRFH